MVLKSKRSGTDNKKQQRVRVKVGRLELNKETVKDLSGDDMKKIKGGQVRLRSTLQCIASNNACF